MTKFVKITKDNIRSGFYINEDGAINDIHKFMANSKRVYDPAMNAFSSMSCFLRYYNYLNKDYSWLRTYYHDVTHITQDIIDEMETRDFKNLPPKHLIRYEGKLITVEQYANKIGKPSSIVYRDRSQYGSSNLDDYYSLGVCTFADSIAVISDDGRYFSNVTEYKKEMDITVCTDLYTTSTTVFDYAERKLK